MKTRITRPNRVRFLLPWIPAALYTALLYALSVRSGPLPFVSSFGLQNIDKAYHVGAYFVLGFILFEALSRTTALKPGLKCVVTVCALGFLCGALNEFSQAFVPARTASLNDALANGVGLMLGAGRAWKSPL